VRKGGLQPRDTREVGDWGNWGGTGGWGKEIMRGEGVRIWGNCGSDGGMDGERFVPWDGGG